MVYSLEIDSSDPMNDRLKENSLIHFFKDNKNMIYSYRLVFRNR